MDYDLSLRARVDKKIYISAIYGTECVNGYAVWLHRNNNSKMRHIFSEGLITTR